ncbi:MAG TPA: class I adenylate-forming enzyme family protein [Xanthobacteraceae bacterium]|nr:class I adenylate-forming enzyme family protein [Xanthobacteraceae bacterium]
MGAETALNRARNLGFFFDRAREATPDKVAVIDLFGGRERQVTYAALDARMDRVAAMLAGLGVQASERVGMLVGNRIEFVELFFGAMRIGAIPIILNTRLAAETLSAIFADAGCRIAVIDPGCNRDAVAIAERLPLAHRIALDAAPHALAPAFIDYETALAAAGAPPVPPALDDGAQAFQPYTSGSTGRPKGAIMTHRGMLWYLDHNQRHWPSRPDDRGCVALPLFHKNALRGTVKPMLYAGGSFVLMPGFEPKAYMETLARYRCTFSRGVAAVFTMVLEHRAVLDALDLTALRAMSIGSAVVPPELLNAVERALPHVKMSESYGLTEGGSPFRAPLDGRAVPRGSVGVQAPGIEVKLIDADGREHPSDGELLIRSPYVCLGYHNQPEVTAAKLADGWLCTGDVFHRDPDGFYFFRSRVDDMFSCGGENIYPKEVENVLFTHPDVADAVVAPVPHGVKGFVPAAMVIARTGARVSGADLRDHCLAHGPAYAHPRFIAIVPQLPLNGAGKIDRAAVRRELAAAYRAQPPAP